MTVSAAKRELVPVDQGVPIAVAANGDPILAPIINSTEAQTTVSAVSGQTVVLSGLLTKRDEALHRRVPLLADIPLVGALFRFDSSRQVRTELLIILTPHVVRSRAEAERLKQVESSRMSWCLSDVVDLHGPAGLRSRTDTLARASGSRVSQSAAGGIADVRTVWRRHGAGAYAHLRTVDDAATVRTRGSNSRRGPARHAAAGHGAKQRNPTGAADANPWAPVITKPRSPMAQEPNTSVPAPSPLRGGPGRGLKRVHGARQSPTIALLMAAILACLGCATGSNDRWKFASWDIRNAMDFKRDDKPDPETPTRVVTTWSDAVKHRPGEKAQRGFGGRLAFFKDASQDPIRVEGELVIYAFDESGADPYKSEPTRRYVFPAEQLDIYESENALGPSYSVWLPWDELGGPEQKISLIARFEPKEGAIIVGEQTKHYLAGTPASPTLADATPARAAHADAGRLPPRVTRAPRCRRSRRCVRRASHPSSSASTQPIRSTRPRFRCRASWRPWRRRVRGSRRRRRRARTSRLREWRQSASPGDTRCSSR